MLCHYAIDRCSRLYRRMAGRQEPAEAGDRGHIPETGRRARAREVRREAGEAEGREGVAGSTDSVGLGRGKVLLDVTCKAHPQTTSFGLCPHRAVKRGCPTAG